MKVSIKEKDRTARGNYKRKVERLTIEFYPTEDDIKNRLIEKAYAGEPKATYIKRLIREDIERHCSKNI